MIKLYPTKPGFTMEWTVEIDFSSLGFPSEERVFPSWQEAVDGIRDYLNEEIKL